MQDRRRLIIILSLVVLVIVVIASLVLPPVNFSLNSVVDIPAGSSTREIADILFRNKIIRSAKVFELMALRQEVAERLQAGFYQFEKPLTVWQIMERLENGIFAGNLVKLTVPEGLSVGELTDLVEKNFNKIDEDFFVSVAEPYAGFLFPDTYLLPPQIRAEQLVKLMRDDFDKRTTELKSEIEESNRSLDEIVNMAAIVEEEAKTKTDRAIIAGILWKRLDKGMRLEVDVATSTYEKVGLPEAPIASPGLESIEATLHPTATAYWFYLSDKQGKMHYATTFTEHQTNIAKYLKK